MHLVDKPVPKNELNTMAAMSFGNLVKAVVDVKRNIMVVDVPLHADGEAFLLTKGSGQSDLWGINLYPELDGEDFVEFDSMINLRPGQGNFTRGVDDPKTRFRILAVVSSLVK